jgi:hypothetical protein
MPLADFLEIQMKTHAMMACAGMALAAVTAHAQDRYLMALNSSSLAPGKRVMLFSPVDGSLINDSFIHESTVGTWGTVKGIHQIGDHIYISDQTRNVVYKYDTAGNYIASLGTGFMSNIRGFDHDGGVLYITNATSVTGGAPGNSIVKLDLDGNYLGAFPVGSSPFSVLSLGSGEMLVGHSSTADISRWDSSGTFLGDFHVGTISYVQQMAFRTSTGTILATGWSGTNIQGLYEFDLLGNQVNYFAVPAPRGVFELDNGNLFWTGSGFNIYDITTNTTSLVAAGTGQYVALLTLGSPCYANCDGSTTEPVLNVDDFTCFINEYASAQTLPHEQQVTAYANCDGSTIAPALNVDDFTCFINAFAQGCP